MLNAVKGKNTYFEDIAEADLYVNSLYSSDSPEGKFWSSLSESDKQRLILSATRLIDRTFQYLGVKACRFLQPLSFPRIIQGIFTPVPDDIKMGILVQAIKSAMESDPNSQSGKALAMLKSGIKTYKVHDASVEFSSSSAVDSTKLPHRLSNGVFIDEVYYEFIEPWTY